MNQPEPTELPPVERERSRLYDEDFVQAMRDSPREWFFVEGERPSRPSYAWAKKKIDGLEVATRKSLYGDYEVYARICP